MKKLVLSLCAVVAIATAVAEKRALQMDDCVDWRVLRNQHVSPDGKWVLFQYSHLFQEKGYPACLFDVERQQVDTLGKLSDAMFLSSRWLKYTQISEPDSLGKTTSVTRVMDLKQRRSTEWQGRSPFFIPTIIPDVVSYTYNEEGSQVRNLCLYNLATRRETIIDSVEMSTVLDEKGRLLYSTGRELRLREVNGRERTIYATDGFICSYNFDGEKGSFIHASSPENRFNPETLCTFDCNGNVRQVFDFSFTEGLPEGLKVAPNPYLPINDGKLIMVDLQPEKFTPPAPRKKLEVGYEVELWAWNEPFSHRRQRPARPGFNPTQAPHYVYDVEAKRFIEIVPAGIMNCVTPQCDRFDYAVYCDTAPYRTQFDWQHELRSDLYCVRLSDGKRTLLLRDTRSMPVWSPDGRYAVVYDFATRRWLRIEPDTGALIDLSSRIGYPIHVESHDMPKDPSAYGIAWWEEDAVVVYDRYDLWRLPMDAEAKATSLTNGYGRAHGVELRVSERRGARTYFTGFDTDTKGTALYVLEKGKVRRISQEGAYGFRLHALSADEKAFVWSRSAFDCYPDLLWSSVNSPEKAIRITDTNPQQADFYWGSARLARWTNDAGKQNDGILYLPEGYDPSRTYPVLVNFYETHSRELFSYRVPEFSSSVIDIPTYVSRGYVVFMPDVAYTIGEPSQSCYDAVVSGVEYLIKSGIADPKRIGLCGHSWGGYQVADLVTRTNLFCCASPGAAVTNLTSSYLALRGRSGVPRLYVYEDAQGRLGKHLWEDPEMYLRNSPIFRADRIRTPLLIFHNEGDDAVPFSEGLALFLAMRRFGQPAWLVNYRGEGHSVNSKEACRDWSMRMEQFFDHYLLHAPAPRWMREGITKEDEGYDLKLD